jgi:hypothetical protein
MEIIPSGNCQSMMSQVAANVREERTERLKAIEEEERKANDKPNPNAKSKLLQQMNLDILMGRNK